MTNSKKEADSKDLDKDGKMSGFDTGLVCYLEGYEPFFARAATAHMDVASDPQRKTETSRDDGPAGGIEP